MTPELAAPTVDTMVPTVDMKAIETFGVPGTKPVDTMIPTVDLSETPVFPSMPSSKPFAMKDIKKALAMTVVKESPTLTAVSASGLIAGTAMSGGNPVLGMVVSKLAPLGYVGYKAAEMALMDPKAFWKNMADLEADLINSEPSFWRGVGQEYAFGIARKYGPEAQGVEAVGEMAGMILRDFVVAAGIGRVVMGAARGAQFSEALRSADKGIRMAAQSQLSLAKGLAFSGSMGLDQGIDRYYTEVGSGTSEKLAMQAAIATGIASGSAGVVFMGMVPAVTAKYGARMFGSYPIPKKMLMSSAEWSGWVGMDQSVKNMIRERVYGLKPDDEMSATDLAKVAGIGAAFSFGGAMVSIALSKGGRSVNRYVSKKIQDHATATEMAEKAQKVDIPDITGVEVNTPKVTEEFAAATGAKIVPAVNNSDISFIGEGLLRMANEQIITNEIFKMMNSRIFGDFSSHKMTAIQMTEIVDRARELMNNGLGDKEALEKAWDGVPSELKNPSNLVSCLRALRAGQ